MKKYVAKPEVVGAALGSSVFTGIGAMVGPKVGIAALGTAFSGAVAVPVALCVVGAVFGYAAIKLAKDAGVLQEKNDEN